MGLIKDFKEFRKKKKQEEFLASLGLTMEDLPLLKEAVRLVKCQGEPVNEEKPVVASTGEHKEEKPNQKMTPEEFIEQFAGEVEEFYPYGRSVN